MKRALLILACCSAIWLMNSCQRYHAEHVSQGDYNYPRNGGFQKVPYIEPETVPGMILIEGDSLSLAFGDPKLRNKKIAPFYIGKHEETIGQYRSFLRFVERYYSPDTYKAVLPDTTEWADAKPTDPITGLTPEQINIYAKWKTDQVNKMILIREGLIDSGFKPKDSTEVFSTEEYLKGNFRATEQGLDLNPYNQGQGKTGTHTVVRMEDGILLPYLRLPSEIEWRWAAYAIGDEDHKYIKTPKIHRKRKIKRSKRFSFLIVEKEDDPENSYYLQGMNNDIPEIAGDSTGYVILANGVPAEYNNTASSLYVLTDTVRALAPESQSGFRLAQPRIGPVWCEKRRCRSKR